MALVARRDHGTEELRRKLASKGFGQDEIDMAIDRLVELGYLDDRRTARRAIESLLGRRKGLLAIRRWLSNRGYEYDLIDELCRAEDVQAGELQACAQAWRRLGCRDEDYAETQRLKQRLARRGFRHETIEKVLRDYAD